MAPPAYLASQVTAIVRATQAAADRYGADHFPTAGADLALSDAAAIAPRVDGVFALVNMDTTTRPMFSEAKGFLDQLPFSDPDWTTRSVTCDAI